MFDLIVLLFPGIALLALITIFAIYAGIDGMVAIIVSLRERGSLAKAQLRPQIPLCKYAPTQQLPSHQCQQPGAHHHPMHALTGRKCHCYSCNSAHTHTHHTTNGTLQMQDYQTWRDLLSDLINNPRERKRIARAIEVDPATLLAWAHYTANPDTQQLHALLQAIPQHQMLLRTLIAEEFDVFDDELPHIASIALSARVLELYTSAPDESRFWSICTAVLTEAVKQLDPDALGLSLSIIQCLPSEDGNVSCLREYIALGTSPWLNQIEMRTRFLGAESLAGKAVSSGQRLIVDEINLAQRLTSNTPEQVISMAAFPIAHSTRIAGCFLLASTQAGYFSSHAHQELIQNYNAMLTLAFSPHDFHEPAQIALQIMPTFAAQQPYLSTLQQRILATLKTAFSANHAISYLEAQQHVYGQIAKELRQLHS